MRKIAIAVFAVILAVSCDALPNFGDVLDQNASIVVEAGAVTETVEFVAVDSWEAKSSVSWIKATPSSGKAGTHEIMLTIEANPDSSPREGTVTISAATGATADINITFTITQKAKEGGNETPGGGNEEKPGGGDEGNGGNNETPGGGEENPGDGDGDGDGEKPGDDHGYGKGEDFGGSFD